MSFPITSTYRVDVLKEPLNHCAPEMIGAVKVRAQEWSTQIGLDLAQAEPWSDDDEDE